MKLKWRVDCDAFRKYLLRVMFSPHAPFLARNLSGSLALKMPIKEVHNSMIQMYFDLLSAHAVFATRVGH